MCMKKKRQIDVSRGKLGMDASPKFVLGNIAQLKARNLHKFTFDSYAFDYMKTTRLIRKLFFGEII